jgi:hypothetical protein
MDNIAELRNRLHKCERLAKDKSTTEHERTNAAAMAEKIRKQLAPHIGKDPKWNDYVKRGKELVKQHDNIQWELGDLVLREVQKDYGEDALGVYAEEIGINASTLKNYRSAALAWPQKDRRRSFSVCSELNAHPQREQVLEKLEQKDKATKAEAREAMKKYNEKKAATEVKEADEPEEEPAAPEPKQTHAEKVLELLRESKNALNAIKKGKITEDDRIDLMRAFAQVQKSLNTAQALFEIKDRENIVNIRSKS